MNTLEILDAVKKSHGLTTDTELANLLECSTAQISQYRTKKRTMDDYTASRVSDLLGLDPMALIAQANAEREKNEEKKEYWKRKAERFLNKAAYACSVAVFAAVTNFVTPSPAQAATLTQSADNAICIMLNTTTKSDNRTAAINLSIIVMTCDDAFRQSADGCHTLKCSPFLGGSARDTFSRFSPRLVSWTRAVTGDGAGAGRSIHRSTRLSRQPLLC